MSHKDCEEWAAMIAQMQDDPSYHPKYNKKGVKPVNNDRGPNDIFTNNAGVFCATFIMHG